MGQLCRRMGLVICAIAAQFITIDGIELSSLAGS